MEISIVAEKLFSIGSLPITNALLIAFLVSFFLVIVLGGVRRKMQLIPRGAQNVVEVIFEELLALMDSVLQDKAQTRKFFPLIATIFLFVLLSNWVGLLPGVGTVGLTHLQDGHDYHPIPAEHIGGYQFHTCSFADRGTRHPGERYCGARSRQVRQEVFYQSVT